jgi:hypothetical protein
MDCSIWQSYFNVVSPREPLETNPSVKKRSGCLRNSHAVRSKVRRSRAAPAFHDPTHGFYVCLKSHRFPDEVRRS